MFTGIVGSNVKLFLILAALFLAQFGLMKTSIKEKEKQIDKLTTITLDQERKLTAQDQEIEELNKYKFIEEGLKAIIAWQNKRYSEIESEYDEFKKSVLNDISNLTPEERDSGKEIDSVWKLYEGAKP